MAHSSLHFFIGQLAGMVIFMPRLVRSFRRQQQLAFAFRSWLILSYSLAVFAIIPNILRRIGVPENICNGWWMNIFMFHSILDQIRHGGMLIGQAGIIACFSFQYVFLLTTLYHVLRKQTVT